GHATFTAMDLSVLLISLLMMILLRLLLGSSPLGRAIRAVAENSKAAALLGIDVEKTIALTFLIAGALGGAAGILIGAQFNAVGILMGQRIELKGLAVIILGGMGSIPGAVLGGFLLGLLEVFSVAYLSSSYRDAIAFAVMFLILIVRPSGLLGRRAARSA
ncbi:MAG: branched-chain amino acid ABC transporter permease, partial [bacterium]|nr:branched-chain amino acid ABC transporter permease [bacterium]